MIEILVIVGITLYSVLYIGGIFMLLFNYQAQINNEANDKREYEQNVQAFSICSAQFTEMADIQNCVQLLNDTEAPMTNPVTGEQFAGFFTTGLKVTRDVLTAALLHKYAPSDDDWAAYQKDAEKRRQELEKQQSNQAAAEQTNTKRLLGWAIAAVVALKIIFK